MRDQPASRTATRISRRGFHLAFAATATALIGSSVAKAARQFTTRRPLTVAVIGDSLANDLGRGMENLYRHHGNIRVLKYTRFSTGLVRTDYFDWNVAVRRFLDNANPDIIIVVIGGNDNQDIRTEQGRLDPLSREWLAEYERRVSAFMAPLQKDRAKIYWVGLPIVRSPSLSRSFHVMNEIYRRQARRHAVRYVSVWDKFADARGAYSSFGKSLEGVRRQLREDDGMHFTEVGSLRFAAQVGSAIGIR
jgi:hypothetical protein